MDSEHSVSGTGRSPREGGEHIPREGGVQILHAVGDGFCCERHSERVRAGGDTTGLSADIKSFRIDSEGLCQPLLLQKRIGDEMTMVDFPKIDSQGFFHDWNGFAMDRFNDPHLPSAGFTRRGVVHPLRKSCLSLRAQLPHKIYDRATAAPAGFPMV